MHKPQVHFHLFFSLTMWKLDCVVAFYAPVKYLQTMNNRLFLYTYFYCYETGFTTVSYYRRYAFPLIVDDTPPKRNKPQSSDIFFRLFSIN